MDVADPPVGRVAVDTLITHTTVVTMNPEREILLDAAVAVGGDRIVAVGETDVVAATVAASSTIDGRRFVVTPGLINTHHHITGEPITRGFVPDDVNFPAHVDDWLCELYSVQTPEDEQLAATIASVEMLRTGTTTVLEAGTIHYLEPVVERLTEIGIRARVGEWMWDRPQEPAVYRRSTAQAIARLEAIMEGTVDRGDLVEVWPMIVGYRTSSEALWQAAKGLADDYGVGLNCHLAPNTAPDPAEGGFRSRTEHLAALGVLGDNVTFAHCTDLDLVEVDLFAQSGCSVAHCPTTCAKVAYGATQRGLVPEMLQAGVNVAVGTDGCNASNHADLMKALYLSGSMYRDARRDAAALSAEQLLEMGTVNGARAVVAADQLGSLEVGKKADLVLWDRSRIEWVPLHDIPSQLVWATDGRSVHSVFVDGKRVVDNYAMTTVDEERLLDAAQRASESLVARTTLVRKSRWPVRQPAGALSS